MAEKDSTPYYDILLIGKTGQGKSTTGNFLLENPYRRNASVPRNDIVDVLYDLRNPVVKLAQKSMTKFVAAATGNKESCTNRPDVLYNPDTNVRVFDTKGFADTNLEPGTTSFANNLGVMRSILTWQAAAHMSFRRVLYFIPNRGPLEKLDGNLQEEIEIMLHFFGVDVFNCMVLVFTLSPTLKRVTTLDDDYGEDWRKSSQEVMLEAIKRTAKRREVKLPEDFKCPPVVFISKAGPSDEVITTIKQAEILLDKPYSFAFRKTVCIKCAGLMKFPVSSERRVDEKRYKDFGGLDPVTVKYDNDDPIEFVHSKCHPDFVSKYSFKQKLGGGLAHIASFGFLRLAEKINEADYKPFFGNSEEVCVACKKSPSKGKGCWKVNTTWPEKQTSRQPLIQVTHYGGSAGPR